MGYDKKKILEKAKLVIEKESVIFIEELVAYLPISKTTLYEFFPVGSDELDMLKSLIDANKTKTKADLRRKWKVSDNATLNIALYKLTATKEEHDLLADRQHVDQKTQNIVVGTEKDKEALESLDNA